MNPYVDLADLVSFRPLERPVPCGYRRSPFSARWSSTVADLSRELRAHGARRAILEIDLPESAIRLDGLPRADRNAYTPGVVLSFEATRVPGKPQLRYEVGTFDDWRDNVRAIALGLEALRAVDRYGVTKRGEQYAGWKALTMGSGAPDAERGRRIIERHGGPRGALKATHPDTREDGYDDAAFRDVQAAIGAGATA